MTPGVGGVTTAALPPYPSWPDLPASPPPSSSSLPSSLTRPGHGSDRQQMNYLTAQLFATVQYITVQHSAVQNSAVQCTVQYSGEQCSSRQLLKKEPSSSSASVPALRSALCSWRDRFNPKRNKLGPFGLPVQNGEVQFMQTVEN